ncbi:hypothetical protein [Luteolibacter luteus]|uniref:Uncharacterized protein n=1 Tax=Luteolibacter luteus TaxID=2728835 RepID=A0A858RKF4_9BACT|nr:hypothetical protein [Luteolibacter luteus]QJE97215.1 hypothetical protein HHL09_15940 [Luteolibacter luteus]
MIRTILAAATGLLMLPPAKADLNPDNWTSVVVEDSASPTGNTAWHFWPDQQNNARILAKELSNQDVVSHMLLETTAPVTLTPPSWTRNDLLDMANPNKEGVFLPNGSDGGDMFAGHQNSGGQQKLYCTNYLNGFAASERIDPVNEAISTISNISAFRDPSGNLHVAYVSDAGTTNERLRYARHPAGGEWEMTWVSFTGSTSPGYVKGTAVIASSLDDVRLYFTYDTPTTNSLLKATPKKIGSVLTIIHQDYPLENIENFVDNSVTASRFNGTERIFYFAVTSLTQRVLKRLVGTTKAELQTVTIGTNAASGPLPRSIFTATAPDGKQRIAWYEGRNRRIHYLKPQTTAAEIPYVSGTPITLANNGLGLTDANLLGFHFSANGLPFLLYRRLLNDGYVAYPKDSFDFNGNKRADLLDVAFNSTNAGLEVLPIDPTEKRMKLRFPTIGSSAAQTTGSNIATVTSSEQNLKYAVQVSTDMVNWTTIGNQASVTYSFTNDGGQNPNQRRTFTAVLTQEAPGNTAKRFARLSVTRTAQPDY